MIRRIHEATISLVSLDRQMVGRLMRTTAKGASLHCNARDFYYPLPKPKAERPPEWDMHIRDWADREIGFSFKG